MCATDRPDPQQMRMLARLAPEQKRAARRVPGFGVHGAMWVAPPEYVIIRKLEFFREGGSEKHLRDVRAMLAAVLELDRDFLAAELRGRGLEPEWLRADDRA